MRIFRRSIHYFEVVARTQSIRAAADALHIAPSAVSRAVQQLEEEVRVPLFSRTARGLQLTVAGETLFASLQRWKHEVQNLADDIRSLKGTRLETIRIAAVEVTTYTLVPQAIASVQKRIPGLGMSLLVGNNPAVLDSILNGSADIGLVISLPQKAPMRALWTMRDPLGLILPPDHPLAKRQSVTFDECLSQPLVLPAEPLVVRLAISAALETARPFRAVATSNRIGAIKAMVKAGMGASILTGLDVGLEVGEGTLRFVPVLDDAIQHPYISLIAPKGIKRSPTTDLVIETLRKAMPSGEFQP